MMVQACAAQNDTLDLGPGTCVLHGRHVLLMTLMTPHKTVDVTIPRLLASTEGSSSLGISFGRKKSNDERGWA